MKSKKFYKLYDVWPLYLVLLIPPILFLTLGAFFVIDSLILVVCFYIFKISQHTQISLKNFFKKNIFKVWGLGIIANIMALLLDIIVGLFIGMSYGPNESVPNYDNLLLITGCLISFFVFFIFNYFIIFSNFSEKQLRRKVSIVIPGITLVVQLIIIFWL